MCDQDSLVFETLENPKYRFWFLSPCLQLFSSRRMSQSCFHDHIPGADIEDKSKEQGMFSVESTVRQLKPSFILHQVIEAEDRQWTTVHLDVQEAESNGNQNNRIIDIDPGQSLLKHGSAVRKIHNYFTQLEFRKCCMYLTGRRSMSQFMRVVHASSGSIDDGSSNRPRCLLYVSRLEDKELRAFKHAFLCAAYPVLAAPDPPSPYSPLPLNLSSNTKHSRTISDTLSSPTRTTPPLSLHDSGLEESEDLAFIPSESICAHLQRAFGLTDKKFRDYRTMISKTYARKSGQKQNMAAELLAEEFAGQLSVIENDCHPFYKPEEFMNPTGYEMWRRTEHSNITELLGKFWHYSLPFPRNAQDLIAELHSVHEDYDILLRKLLVYEHQFHQEAEDSGGHLVSPLSSASVRLLKEFGLRFGVGEQYRRIMHLEQISQDFSPSLWYLKHAMSALNLIQDMMPSNKRAHTLVRKEFLLLKSGLSRLFTQVSKSLEHMKSLYPGNKPVGGVDLMISLLQCIQAIQNYFVPAIPQPPPLRTVLIGIVQGLFLKTYEKCKTVIRTELKQSTNSNSNICPRTINALMVEMREEVFDYKHNFESIFMPYFDIATLAAKTFYSFLMKDVDILTQQEMVNEDDAIDLRNLALVYRLNQLDRDWSMYISAKDQTWRQSFQPHVEHWLKAFGGHLQDLVIEIVGGDSFITQQLQLIESESYYSSSSSSSLRTYSVSTMSLTPSVNSAFCSISLGSHKGYSQSVPETVSDVTGNYNPFCPDPLDSSVSRHSSKDEVCSLNDGSDFLTFAEFRRNCNSAPIFSNGPAVVHAVFKPLRNAVLGQRQDQSHFQALDNHNEDSNSEDSTPVPEQQEEIASSSPHAEELENVFSGLLQLDSIPESHIFHVLENGSSVDNPELLVHSISVDGSSVDDEGESHNKINSHDFNESSDSEDSSDSEEEGRSSERQSSDLDSPGPNEAFSFPPILEVSSNSLQNFSIPSVISQKGQKYFDDVDFKDQENVPELKQRIIFPTRQSFPESKFSSHSIEDPEGFGADPSRNHHSASIRLSPDALDREQQFLQSVQSTISFPSPTHIQGVVIPISGSAIDMIVLLQRGIAFGHTLCQTLFPQPRSPCCEWEEESELSAVYLKNRNSKIIVQENIVEILCQTLCVYADNILYLDLCGVPKDIARQVIGAKLVNHAVKQQKGDRIWGCRHQLDGLAKCSEFCNQRAVFLCDRYEPITQKMCVRVNNLAACLHDLEWFEKHTPDLFQSNSTSQSRENLLSDDERDRLRRFFSQAAEKENEVSDSGYNRADVSSSCQQSVELAHIHLMSVWTALCRLLAFRINLFLRDGLSLLLQLKPATVSMDTCLMPLTTFLRNHLDALSSWLYQRSFRRVMEFLWIYIVQDIEREANKLTTEDTKAAHSLLQALTHLMKFMNNCNKGITKELLLSQAEYVVTKLRLITMSTLPLIALYMQLNETVSDGDEGDENLHNSSCYPLPIHAIHQLHRDLQTRRKCFSGAQLIHWLMTHAELISPPDELSLHERTRTISLHEALEIAQHLLDQQIIVDIETENSVRSRSASLGYPEVSIHSQCQTGFFTDDSDMSTKSDKTISDESLTPTPTPVPGQAVDLLTEPVKIVQNSSGDTTEERQELSYQLSKDFCQHTTENVTNLPAKKILTQDVSEPSTTSAPVIEVNVYREGLPSVVPSSSDIEAFSSEQQRINKEQSMKLLDHTLTKEDLTSGSQDGSNGAVYHRITLNTILEDAVQAGQNQNPEEMPNFYSLEASRDIACFAKPLPDPTKNHLVAPSPMRIEQQGVSMAQDRVTGQQGLNRAQDRVIGQQGVSMAQDTLTPMSTSPGPILMMYPSFLFENNRETFYFMPAFSVPNVQHPQNSYTDYNSPLDQLLTKLKNSQETHSLAETCFNLKITPIHLLTILSRRKKTDTFAQNFLTELPQYVLNRIPMHPEQAARAVCTVL